MAQPHRDLHPSVEVVGPQLLPNSEVLALPSGCCSRAGCDAVGPLPFSSPISSRLSAPQHIKAFYNATWSQRYGHGLPPGPLTLLYSLTVSVFALGGLGGSLLVGTLVARYGR